MATLVLLAMLLCLMSILLPLLVLLLALLHLPVLTLILAVPGLLVTADWILASSWPCKWVGVLGFLVTAYGAHLAITQLLAR